MDCICQFCVPPTFWLIYTRIVWRSNRVSVQVIHSSAAAVSPPFLITLLQSLLLSYCTPLHSLFNLYIHSTVICVHSVKQHMFKCLVALMLALKKKIQSPKDVDTCCLRFKKRGYFQYILITTPLSTVTTNKLKILSNEQRLISFTKEKPWTQDLINAT